ncbi:hypothetical protein [Salipiger sp. PrR002]|uniref:hypothetical protein n=1 Tax=unclassified Salipiger TaxID=2640570 RepID=UPI0013B77C93|nr:hypothetical protein [Salipiger sp. PrR002]NDW02629.1 hypothetical protein [Salipiger sp. PrR002]NDW59878.1 hypothetical protein [Salipiger sp. PrR004]
MDATLKALTDDEGRRRNRKWPDAVKARNCFDKHFGKALEIQGENPPLCEDACCASDASSLLRTALE